MIHTHPTSVRCSLCPKSSARVDHRTDIHESTLQGHGETHLSSSPSLTTMSNQRDIDALHRNWVWVTDWQDSSTENTAGRLVTFTRKVQLDSVPSQAIIQCTADTRYKLLVNGFQICAGPSRSAPERWLYDTVDLAAHLVQGENTLVFVVMRWFYANRAAMPFVRTGHPGLTVTGTVGATDISTGAAGWTATVDFGTLFPTGLIDDVFLHVSQCCMPADARSTKGGHQSRHPHPSRRTICDW